MCPEDSIQIHAKLNEALDHLGKARIEVIRASQLARKPYVSRAMTAVFRAYSIVKVARAEASQEIDEARQMPLGEHRVSQEERNA